MDFTIDDLGDFFEAFLPSAPNISKIYEEWRLDPR